MLCTPKLKWSGNSLGFAAMPFARFGQEIDMYCNNPLMPILDGEIFSGNGH